MSSTVTSCFKCQINFSCEITLKFHQLIFHFESDDELDPPLTDISHQDVGEQAPSSEQNPCEEPQNEIDDFDRITFNEVPSTEADCELDSFMDLYPLLFEYQDVQKNLGEQVLAITPNPCEESQNENDDFDWTIFDEVPRTEVDCGLKLHMDLDPQLTKHQDVQEDLGEQILTTEPYPGEESQNYIDDFDWTTFIKVPRTEVSYNQEQNKHHKTVQKKFRKEKKDLKYDVCHKAFTQQSHLKKHIKTVHDKQSDYECDVYQKTFSLQGNLKKHIKTVHDKEKDYECDVCQKTFTQKHRLKSHVNSVHEGRRDYECNVCQKTFTQKYHLKMHVKTVHEKRRDYECDVCQKRFSRITIMTKHKKIVHDKRKDYKCDECHKVFSEQGNLKQHKNAVHEGQKNFECGTRQKTFTQQKKLDKTPKISSSRTKRLRVRRASEIIFTARPFEDTRKNSS